MHNYTIAKVHTQYAYDLLAKGGQWASHLNDMPKKHRKGILKIYKQIFDVVDVNKSAGVCLCKKTRNTKSLKNKVNDTTKNVNPATVKQMVQTKSPEDIRQMLQTVEQSPNSFAGGEKSTVQIMVDSMTTSLDNKIDSWRTKYLFDDSVREVVLAEIMNFYAILYEYED